MGINVIRQYSQILVHVKHAHKDGMRIASTALFVTVVLTGDGVIRLL